MATNFHSLLQLGLLPSTNQLDLLVLTPAPLLTEWKHFLGAKWVSRVKVSCWKKGVVRGKHPRWPISKTLRRFFLIRYLFLFWEGFFFFWVVLHSFVHFYHRSRLWRLLWTGMSWCFCTSWRKEFVSQAMPPTSPHWQACQPASFREELRLIRTHTERPQQSDVLGLRRLLMCAGRCHIFTGKGGPSNVLTKRLQTSEPTGLLNSVCT